ncbi:hypothetical protein B0A54_06100 [Friedmanniomyces endolithicus]|uniref:Uncharacterized protein n=1 Tax=Friedmanniomyces endolithicus TaxID=329885 RepID=A0A4U0V4C5_9PEZI|nr:hypothetical protein B0A54_06100 [Friedmanniomyces endolithicus]
MCTGYQTNYACGHRGADAEDEVADLPLDGRWNCLAGQACKVLRYSPDGMLLSRQEAVQVVPVLRITRRQAVTSRLQIQPWCAVERKS